MQRQISRTHVGMFIALVLAMAGLLYAVEANRGTSNFAIAGMGPTGDTGDTTPTNPKPGKVTFRSVKLNKSKGTAKVVVSVNQSGRVVLNGGGVKRTTKAKRGRGLVALTLAANGSKLKALKKKGAVKVRVKATFTPSADARRDTASKTVTLKKKRRK